MNGKDRIRSAMNYEEADRVPLFEAAFSSKLASQILEREVYLPSNGGRSFRHFLRAHMRGSKAAEQAAIQAGKDVIELYSLLGLDMVRVRVTDFLAPVDFGYGNYGGNFLFNVEICELEENRWRITGEDGFWSEHIYEPSSDAMMCVAHPIATGGLPEFRRWVDLLEKRSTQTPPEAEPGLAGVRAAVDAADPAGIFVLGWGDVAYPGSSPYLPLFLEAMVTDPELIHRYMEITTAGALSFVQSQLDIGVDGIIGGNDWCFKTGPMFSPSNFRTFFVPHLRKIVELCHSRGVPYIKHLDGNTTRLLDMLVDEIGIDAHHPIEPSAGMDIAALKKKYDRRLTLIGNLECGELLSQAEPEQVAAQAKTLLRTMAPGGGYIFSSSNSIHDGVKLDNLYAMLDTVHTFGKYPITL